MKDSQAGKVLRAFGTLLLTLLLSFSFVSPSAADQPPRDPEYRNCSWYRAKKNGVPVYAQAADGEQVISTLSIGEYVCYVGERGEFAIIDWEKQERIRNSKKLAVFSGGFVKLSDLWAPKEGPGSDARSDKSPDVTGASPEDPLRILRPFLGSLLDPDPCSDKTRVGCKEFLETEQKKQK